mmetsp:Transcript_30007/g.77789  ORF Transcript_30007/g.77789 Transcript_30007/m.77789 type:complete len:252 (-) Transcript_30007:2380-3135(-)
MSGVMSMLELAIVAICAMPGTGSFAFLGAASFVSSANLMEGRDTIRDAIAVRPPSIGASVVGADSSWLPGKTVSALVSLPSSDSPTACTACADGSTGPFTACGSTAASSAGAAIFFFVIASVRVKALTRRPIVFNVARSSSSSGSESTSLCCSSSAATTHGASTSQLPDVRDSSTSASCSCSTCCIAASRSANLRPKARYASEAALAAAASSSCLWAPFLSPRPRSRIARSLKLAAFAIAPSSSASALAAV